MTNTRLFNWIEARFAQPTPQKFNSIVDLDKLKYERILRLREIAQKEHNHAKFYQANRLLTEITSRLNSRFHNCNSFNFN